MTPQIENSVANLSWVFRGFLEPVEKKDIWTYNKTCVNLIDFWLGMKIIESEQISYDVGSCYASGD